MSSSPKQCPDCSATLEQIRMIDATIGGVHRKGVGHVPLHYTHMKDRKSGLMERYLEAAPVQSYMCTGCGRILMYGTPR